MSYSKLFPLIRNKHLILIVLDYIEFKHPCVNDIRKYCNHLYVVCNWNRCYENYHIINANGEDEYFYDKITIKRSGLYWGTG
jgi:hypothetical protein